MLAKAGVLVVLLATLSGFTVLSHMVSHSSATRIDCLDNQRETAQALLMYQADHDGANPPDLDAFLESGHNHSALLGRCPCNHELHYYIGATTGRVFCPDPAHRPTS